MLFPAVFRSLLPPGLLLAAVLGIQAQGTSHLLLDYDSQTGDFTYLNNSLGTGIFYSQGYLGGNTIVANIEAGNIWFDHDAFVRPPAATAPFYTFTNTAGSNQLDYHATAVGHVLAGTGYVMESNPEQFYLVGIGMAPYAGLWSGAIATDFSADNLGSFSTTTASTIAPYKEFFTGENGGVRPDVINSSWGTVDPRGTSPETLAIDGLAALNPSVALVVSAGNGGSAAVAGPASGYNNISVGSVGGATLLDPSDFSSRGPADFYNPLTGEVLGQRAAVDLAAPGENLVLAAYLGNTGSLGASNDPEIQGIVEQGGDLSADLYFLELDGTSFSAPIVAGGIALLKDVAKSEFYAEEMGAEALDSRVVKSVLMAGARETTGWDNGQVNEDGVIITTQALDYATGAGALDLENAAAVYVGGTTDLDGTGGGAILTRGWDLARVDPSGKNDYLFASEFSEPTELTVSLNWFAGRTFDSQSDLGADLSFADLNLQVWLYAEGEDPLLVAESASLYNNSEFLRLLLSQSGQYGLTVEFQGMIYGPSGSLTSEYGLAWQAVTVPEPASWILIVIGAGTLATRRRARR
jgi:hypothetical protein